MKKLVISLSVTAVTLGLFVWLFIIGYYIPKSEAEKEYSEYLKNIYGKEVPIRIYQIFPNTEFWAECEISEDKIMTLRKFNGKIETVTYPKDPDLRRFSVNGFVGEIYDDEADILTYEGYAEVITVLSEIKGFPVKTVSGLGDHEETKQIIISDGIEVLHLDYLMNYGSLEEIFIPKSVNKFYGSDLSLCAKLKKIHVDENNANYRDIDGILYSKDKTKLLGYPTAAGDVFTIPDFVTEIEDGVFNPKMKKIVIGENVSIKIQDKIFNTFLLESDKKPQTVLVIKEGSSAFKYAEYKGYIYELTE